MSGEELRSLADRVMPSINAVEAACTDAVLRIIPANHQGGPIACSESQWEDQASAFEERDAFYAAMMPVERDAIRVMHAAFDRLKALGWREAIYCPKDGSQFDAIEPGSTGIHVTHYEGEWPTGSWWVAADGDLYPARPILYRPTQAEVRAREEARERFARATLADQERSR